MEGHLEFPDLQKDNDDRSLPINTDRSHGYGNDHPRHSTRQGKSNIRRRHHAHFRLSSFPLLSHPLPLSHLPPSPACLTLLTFLSPLVLFYSALSSSSVVSASSSSSKSSSHTSFSPSSSSSSS